MLGAARPVATLTARVAVVVAVAITAVVLAGRVLAAARRGRAAATTGGAATVTIPARVEAPRGRRRCACPLGGQSQFNVNFSSDAGVVTHLDLQDVVAAKSLVMHVMVRIIGITAIFVLDKGKTVGMLVRHARTSSGCKKQRKL